MAKLGARALCASAFLWIGRCLKTDADDKVVISNHEGMRTLRSIIPSSEDPLLRDVLGHITTAELAGTLEALPQVLRDPKFMLVFNTGSANIQKSASDFASAASEKIRRFWKPGQEASVDEFIPMLADVLTENEWRAKNYFDVLHESRKDLVKVMSPLLKVSSESLLDTLVPESLPFRVNGNGTLAQAGWYEACQTVTPMMDKIKSIDAKIKVVLRVIEATAKMVPMLTTTMPDLTEDVPVFVNSFINLARVDATNVEKVTSQAMKVLVPLVEKRLHCADAPAPAPAPVPQGGSEKDAALTKRLASETMQYMKAKKPDKRFDLSYAVNKNLENLAKEASKPSGPAAPAAAEPKESAAASRSPFGLVAALALVRLIV